MCSVPVGCLVPPGLRTHSRFTPPAPETDPRVRVPSQEKAAFRELIAQLELDPKCRGLPLSSFLILPFQRITRLKLLIQVPHALGLRTPLPLQAVAFGCSRSLLAF